MRRSLIVDKVALAQMKTDELNRYAGVAQSVEQLIRNQQVRCSSHPTSSKIRRNFKIPADFCNFFLNYNYLTFRNVCTIITIGESQNLQLSGEVHTLCDLRLSWAAKGTTNSL